MPSAETKPDTEPPIPFDRAINQIAIKCKQNQVTMYDDLQPRVEELYKELNMKLLNLYSPVLDACRTMRSNRDEAIRGVVERSLRYQLTMLINGNEAFEFDPNDLKDHFFVHAWTPEYITEKPYEDTDLCKYELLKMSIHVSFPSVATDKSTGRTFALTASDLEDNFLANTPLDDAEPTISRGRQVVSFDYDYEYHNLTIEPDSTYCEYPNFPTRPVPTTK